MSSLLKSNKLGKSITEYLLIYSENGDHFRVLFFLMVNFFSVLCFFEIGFA